MKGQESSQTKFIWTVAILQCVILAFYWLLFRYNDQAAPFPSIKAMVHGRNIAANLSFRFLLFLSNRHFLLGWTQGTRF